MLIAYEFRIYPTKEQETLMSKHFGCARYVYNYFLGKCKEKEKYSSYATITKELTTLKKEKKHEWLKEVSTHVLQQSLKDLDEAYSYFFNKTAKYPVFKRKNSVNSFRTLVDIKLENKRLYIQKFREGIKIKQHRKLSGVIRNCTISRTNTGRYYASIVCKDSAYKPWDKTGKIVGIDTGVENLATLSNGKIYENIKALKQYSKKIDYLQRQLSRKTVGSCAFVRMKYKISRLHERVANIRQDYLHKVSTEIVKNHDSIFVEDLDLLSLYKQHSIARSLEDVGIGKFYNMLEYKSQRNGRTYRKIDRFFPSSKNCSTCGYKYSDLKLKERAWECPRCGCLHDRDVNAATNILREGLNFNIKGCGTQS